MRYHIDFRYGSNDSKRKRSPSDDDDLDNDLESDHLFDKIPRLGNPIVQSFMQSNSASDELPHHSSQSPSPPPLSSAHYHLRSLRFLTRRKFLRRLCQVSRFQILQMSCHITRHSLRLHHRFRRLITRRTRILRHQMLQLSRFRSLRHQVHQASRILSLRHQMCRLLFLWVGPSSRYDFRARKYRRLRRLRRRPGNM